jgi:hypothetical protein
MTAKTVDVSDFVSVSVNVTPLAIPYLSFGLPLIVGDSNVIDVNERYRSYSSIDQVGADFGSSAPEYLAAELLFSQNPQPAKTFIGRWAAVASKGLLHGASLSATQQLLTNFTSISSGAMFIEIDGIPHAISGISFIGDININGLASSIQAELPAGVTCTWDSDFERFNIQSSTTGPTSEVGYAGPPTAVGFADFTGVPTASDTLTIDGTVITFIANGDSPTSGEVAVGTDVPSTLTALLTYLNASVDTNIVKCDYFSDGVAKIYLAAVTPGTGGDAYTLAKSSTAITLSGSTLAGGTGVDVSTLLGLTSAAGASPPVEGVAAEQPLAALQACANVSTEWYGAMFAAATAITDAQHEANAAYILASSRNRMYGLTIMSSACLDSTQTSDLASVLQSLNNKRVFWMYSSSNPYACATMYGRAATVNFAASDSTITLAWKQAPGLQSENMNETQFATLKAKGGNVNIAVNNGASMIWPGQMTNGYWFDEVQGVDWLANQIQTDLFNLMYTTSTKVPQTDAGNHIIQTIIESSCIAGINNGLGAPGVWNAAGFGSLQTGMTLSKGFYVYAPLIATQSEADRESRISVPFQVAFKLAGAVHTPNVILNINR